MRGAADVLALVQTCHKIPRSHSGHTRSTLRARGRDSDSPFSLHRASCLVRDLATTIATMQRSQSQCRGGCANGTSRAPLRPACFAHANVVATSVLDRSCRACGVARLILAWSSGPSAFSCLSGFVQCCAATWARSRAASSDILSRCTSLHPAEPAPPSNTARQRHKYSSSRRRTVAAGVAPGVTHSGRRSPPRHTWRASRKRYTLPTSTATCSDHDWSHRTRALDVALHLHSAALAMRSEVAPHLALRICTPHDAR